MTYPILDYRGNYTSVTATVAFRVLTADFGDGYTESSLVGSAGGTRTWALTYSALHMRPFGAGASSFVSQSRAEYVSKFYCDRMAAGNEPFILLCPRENKRFLVAFVDTTLTFALVSNLLATTGVNLKQVRVSGVTTGSDGSIP